MSVFFSDPYVLPLIKFCESIEEKLDKTAVSQSIHKDILNFLKERKPQVYSCFHLLEELCMAHQTRTLSLVQNPENVYCECFRDKWWQWTLNFIDAYQKSLVITEYLSYSFEPKLSSGEMAFLTLWGRLYDYLINRNNEHILLFLDEIEITLHPEWQRRLVSDMIEFLNKFARENHIHLLFSSHSPILLSDIPIENVCFLQRRGNCSTVVTPKIHNTFGANIYDLYREPFFLANGVVGEFSSRKIDCWVQCLRQITCDNGKAQSINDELQKINSNIQIIGDDLFRKQIEKVIKAIMTMREFQSSGREVNNDKN